MRILQLFNRYRERGGEEKSADRIFCHTSEICEIDRIWWDSRDWDPPTGPGPLGQLRRMFHNKDTAVEVQERISQFHPDALLCHNLYPVGSPSIYGEARAAGLPVVQFVHNFRPFSVGGSLWTGDRVAEESLHGDYLAEIKSGAWQDSVVKSALFAVLLKKMHASGLLDTVKAWVCISEFMRKQFLKAGLPKERVYALKHSWDSREFEQHNDRGYYLFLSRLVKEKGVSVLLDAWKLLERELGDKTPVLKIGGTGALEPEVKKAAQASPAIEYLGFVSGDSKAEFISGCRAMIAPSVWWEPLGLVTYEAYDFGKPMLAAASGGLTETIQNGLTGFLFKPNDPAAIADAVISLEKLGEGERSLMGQKGNDWLKSEANPKLWKNEFAKILEEVVNR